MGILIKGPRLALEQQDVARIFSGLMNATTKNLDRIASSQDKLFLSHLFLSVMLSSATPACVFGNGNLGETGSVCPLCFSYHTSLIPPPSRPTQPPLASEVKTSHLPILPPRKGNATSTTLAGLINMAPTSDIGLGADC